MIEDLSGVAVDVEYASEYCYRSTHAAVEPIVMVITQSGETADTIAAQREALTRGVKTIAISNVPDTTIVREAGAALISGAGPELSIPATKSFTTQLTILYLMALFLARKRGRMTSEVTRSYLQRLSRLPDAIEKNLRDLGRSCREIWRKALQGGEVSLSRPRRALRHRARGRAQAQGNLLRARRRISRRRTQARPQRAGRRETSRRRAGDLRPSATRIRSCATAARSK